MLAVVAGLGGVIIPILPGLSVQLAAIGIWALIEGSSMAWIVFGITFAVAAYATYMKYQRPGKRLRDSGLPTGVLLIAVITGIVGFFVIPIIGGPLGFVATIYLFEARRRDGEAWASTKRAVGAVLESIAIEFAGGVIITGIFLGGILLG